MNGLHSASCIYAQFSADINPWRVWIQNPINAHFKVFKVSPSLEQNKTFPMIPHSLHNKEYFWSYDDICDIFCYYFLCFSAALIANISNWWKWIYRFLNLNCSHVVAVNLCVPVLSLVNVDTISIFKLHFLNYFLSALNNDSFVVDGIKKTQICNYNN